jgi:hypothetical protein
VSREVSESMVHGNGTRPGVVIYMVDVQTLGVPERDADTTLAQCAVGLHQIFGF